MQLAELNLKFGVMYTSALKRAQLTGKIILDVVGQSDLEIIENEALNERDYGDLTGSNKDEAKENFGAEQVQIWRRSYDNSPPGGESLRDTYNRVIPYFKKEILPLMENNNVLISAHGNSLRALVKYLDNISEEDIVRLEISTGEPILYKFINGKFIRQ